MTAVSEWLNEPLDADTKNPMTTVCPNGLIISDEFPDRAVKQVWAGYAIYLRVGDAAAHQGVGNLKAATQWLNGEPRENIEILKVVHSGK